MQPPVITDLSDVQAGERHRTTRCHQFPSIAGEAVMGIDTGGSAAGVVREFGLHNGRLPSGSPYASRWLSMAIGKSMIVSFLWYLMTAEACRLTKCECNDP